MIRTIACPSGETCFADECVNAGECMFAHEHGLGLQPCDHRGALPDDEVCPDCRNGLTFGEPFIKEPMR